MRRLRSGQGESFCESGPVIGEPAAVVVAAVSALLILYFVYRIVRILVQRLGVRRAESGETPG